MNAPMLDPESTLLGDEYVRGVGEFMDLAYQQSSAKKSVS